MVVTFGEVTSLDHKVLNNSVKRGAFEAQLFPCDFAASLFTCEQTKTSHENTPVERTRRRVDAPDGSRCREMFSLEINPRWERKEWRVGRRAASI